MSRKRYSPEEIISKLREAEVLLSQDKTVSEVVRQLGVSEQTYYRWEKEYGGLDKTQARKLKAFLDSTSKCNFEGRKERRAAVGRRA